MIPLLYDKTGKIKLGELTNCIECLVEEERNGLFELSLIYPTNDTLFNLLEKGNIIICNTSDTLKNQKFRIYNTRKLMSNRIEVLANHISYDLGYDIVTKLKLKGQRCEYALNEIFRNSQNSKHYKGYSDIMNTQNYEMSLNNCLNAIVGTKGSIIDTFGNGAELLRDNENIHVLNNRGEDNNVFIEYRKNLTDISVEEDTTDLYNVILPIAKYKPSSIKEDLSGDISNLRFYRNKSDYNTTSDGEMFIGAIDSKGNVISKGQSVTIKVYGKEYQFKTRALNPYGNYKVPLKEKLELVSQTTSMNVYAVWVNTKSPTGYYAIRIDEGNTDATTPWSWTWLDSHFKLGEFSMSKAEFVSSGHINKKPTDSPSREEVKEDTQEEDVIVIGDLVKSERSHDFLAFDRITTVDFSEYFEGEVPTNEKLKTLAKQYFKSSEIDMPSINYKISFVPLSKTTEGNGIIDNLSLCDKVTVKDERYDINFKTKVIKTTFNVLKDRYEQIELNTSKSNLSDVFNSTNDKINNLESDLKDKISNALSTPDTLPSIPNLSLENGFATIRLSWTYESKSYYDYELYASQNEGFEPSIFDLIFKGNASYFIHNVKPSQTWYYKVRCVNKRGSATDFSSEAIGETFKIDNADNYFEEAAIGSALIGSLNADVINGGKVKGFYIDARNLSVTDGNGKITFQVKENGDTSINGKIESDSVIMANGGIYTNQDIRGRSKEGFTLVGTYGQVALRSDEGNVYLQPADSEVKVTAPADPDTFKDLRASNLIANNKVYASGVALTSSRDKKKNIEDYTESALSEICSTPIRQYHLKTDLDKELKRIGVILQEAPLNAIDLGGEGVDLYQMITMSWKAIQELKEEINNLK